MTGVLAGLIGSMAGIFEIPELNVEYLVIAGGAGGGDGSGRGGGGGGAGGYRSSVSGESSGGGAFTESALTLVASTNYTVTVGAGGAGGINTDWTAPNGSNSVFDTITSIGGGGGSRDVSTSGADGGSGGGCGGSFSFEFGGVGTAGQGYDGGYAEGGFDGGAGQEVLV
jgi:hypothetical protein